jgi:hypothetical protein
VGNPEVDRWRSLLQVDSQFGEDVVAQVYPGARENESNVTWRFAGRWLFRERPELAGLLWWQVWAQADEVPTLRNSHFAIVRTCACQTMCALRSHGGVKRRHISQGIDSA